MKLHEPIVAATLSAIVWANVSLYASLRPVRCARRRRAQLGEKALLAFMQ